VEEGALHTECHTQKTKSLVERIVEHDRFIAFIGIVVVINCIIIGVQTDYMARHWLMDSPPAFEMSERVCFVIFVVEITMRIYVSSWSFVCSSEVWYNLFDFLLVVMQAYEQFSGQGNALLALRAFRIARIVRIARTMHTFLELKVLIASIEDALLEMGWVVLLLAGTVYIISVGVTQVVTEYTRAWQTSRR